MAQIILLAKLLPDKMFMINVINLNLGNLCFGYQKPNVISPHRAVGKQSDCTLRKTR